MADDAQEPTFALPLVYIEADETPVFFCNQVISQYHQDGFIVTFGQLSPPILLGTEEEQREQASDLSYVPVKILTRLSFTPERMRELIKVLQTNLDGYQARMDSETE